MLSDPHSISVSSLARKFGIALGFAPLLVEQLTVAGTYHDGIKIVGQRSFYASIRGILLARDDPRWALIREHPQQSADYYRYLCQWLQLPVDVAVYEGILGHHQNEDGSGYPQIELTHPDGRRIARMLRIFDSFDAATHNDRPHRAPKTPSQVCAEIRAGAGTIYRREYALAFCDLIERGHL